MIRSKLAGGAGRALALPLLLIFVLMLSACGPEEATSTVVVAPTATGIPSIRPGATEAAPLPTDTVGVTTGIPTAVVGAVDTPAAKKVYKIGILQTATHPALDFTQVGIKQAFTAAGLVEGTDVTFDVQNAELDAPTASKMAQAMIANNDDAIVTIGSLTSVAALAETMKANSQIPIIFSAVADPYLAKLAGTPNGDVNTADPKVHPDNLTGVQAFPPVADGLRLITQVKPGAKTVGLLWNPQEPNSQATTNEARRVAASLGLTLIDRTATRPAETLAAAQALAGFGIDAFFVSTTNSVVNGLDSVVRVAQENKIPLFGNDPLSASRGAVAALGLDYTQNGQQAGQIALAIVSGKTTAKATDIQATTAPSLCVNTQAATLEGVTLPDSILSQATACTYSEIKNPAPPPAGPTATSAP